MTKQNKIKQSALKILKLLIIIPIFALGFLFGLGYDLFRKPQLSCEGSGTPLLGHIKSKYFDLLPFKYDGYFITNDVAVSEIPTLDIAPFEYSSVSRPFSGFIGYDQDAEPQFILADVNNDNIEEKVYLISDGRPFPPQSIQVVDKNDNVIFEAKNLKSVDFQTSKSNLGFYLISRIEESTGECCYSGYKHVRIYFESNEFKPVWESKTKYLRVLETK